MTLTDFINRVIDDGIEAAKKSYEEGTAKRDGAIAGFEACRGKTPGELSQLLDESRKVKHDRDRCDTRWYYVTYHAEIDWVCNCVSAILHNQGLEPIMTPTMRGVMKAASIVGVSGDVEHL